MNGFMESLSFLLFLYLFSYFFGDDPNLLQLSPFSFFALPQKGRKIERYLRKSQKAFSWKD